MLVDIIIDIIMYIFVGLIIITLCIAFIKMIYDEIKFKKLIGQDLSNYDIKELVKLLNIYERIFKSRILYKDTLFGEEAGRIRVELEKRINNKNDIKRENR